MMRTEQRKKIRRVVRQTARLVQADGTDLGACTMIDISETGAYLKPENAETLPDQFILLLSSNAVVRRQCAVAWRSDEAVGVQFISPNRASNAGS
jgi:hypothetical protein